MPARSTASHIFLLDRVCPFCDKAPADDDVMYLVNSAGGYGMPEMWACSACMRNAEPDSKMADLRDGAYAEDFRD